MKIFTATICLLPWLKVCSAQTTEEYRCCPDGDSSNHCYYNIGEWANVSLVICDQPSFFLWTRTNPVLAKTITIDGPIPDEYDGSKETVYIIHGWTNNGKEDWIIAQKDMYLEYYDYNIISVDWADGASDLYEDACSNTRVAAHETAQIMRLLSSETTWTKQWCTGQSLGAHVCGLAGEDLQITSSGKDILNRITGMDPAGPWWDNRDITTGLDSSDATLVDNLHTNGNMYGTFRALGHKDYYPNGGGSQPDCPNVPLSFCSHDKSRDYMTQTIANNVYYPANATCTDSFDLSDSCTDCTDCGYMGFAADDPGNYGNYTVEASSVDIGPPVVSL